MVGSNRSQSRHKIILAVATSVNRVQVCMCHMQMERSPPGMEE